ncbi:MAG TPA: AgmX/PglI C-terminal domain-containing protein [Myxococcota bacterium]|nr:AgmX/PglI C-terminal domain-containing protein [Myxococcota bacterium]
MSDASFQADSALRESALRADLEASQKRVDELERALRSLDAERESLLAKIRAEQQSGELIADDLDEIERAEEERKLEWVIEREATELPYRAAVMPWARGREDDRLFQRALARTLAAALLLGVLLPWIPLPIPERWELIEVPDRFVRLMEERVAPPPEQELLPEPREPKPIEEQPLLAEQGMPEPIVGEQRPTPAGGSKGILAFREQFSALAEAAAPARLGSQARITRSGEVASGRATRSLVATEGPGTSGGIDIAALSRDVGGAGGAGLEGVAVARASSAIGGTGGSADRPLSGGPGSARTDEAIQIVFDRHTAALYRLYNRELRRDPTLQGQIVLRMTIEPDGSVSFCEVQSSDMKAPDLVAQVVDRVKTFDFGAEEGIPAITILYPIDFLPAA